MTTAMSKCLCSRTFKLKVYFMLYELQIFVFHIFTNMDIGRKFIASYSGHCVDSIDKMAENTYRLSKHGIC